MAGVSLLKEIITMDRCESYVQKLLNADSRRKIIKKLRKTVKWSFYASTLFILAAFAAYFGPRPTLSGIMMGIAAMNLAVGATNANSLTLALYVEETEKKKSPEHEKD